MKLKSKVVSVSATATAATIQSALDASLNTGWTFVGIYQVGTNFFAILIRIISL